MPRLYSFVLSRAFIGRLRFSSTAIACALFALLASVTLAALPPELRIVTYNIHHGEGTDNKFDLPRIAKVVMAENPDIVALQEVDQKTNRASGVDQPAEFA